MTTTTSSVSTTLASTIDDLTLTGTADINGTGNARNNVITGNSGANVLNGLAGVDTLIGGAGNDTYVVDTSADVVVEKADEGVDTVQAAATYTLSDNVENLILMGTGGITGSGNALDNSITGNNGSNTLNGGGGNDTLVGNAGSDLLDGGSGADDMQGGVGDDIYVVDEQGDRVTEAAAAGNDTVRSTITYALGDNVENLVLNGAASIDGTGNSLDNVMVGNAGNNSLSGGAGNDTLNGGQGADDMDGGSGDDSYVVDNADDLVRESAGAGEDTIQSIVGYALSANVENLTLTGTAAIDGAGNELDNTITGNSGANVLRGLAGDDHIDGGAGADTMVGGSGDDTYVVDNIGDVAVEEDGEGIDKVLAGATHALGAFVENLTLTGLGAINGTGNELDNTIVGNGANNLLRGGAGNDTLTDNGGHDTLDGGLGADSMQGGAGNDVYVVDNAGDLVIEAYNGGTDTAQSSIDYTLTANVEHLVLTGSADLKGGGNDLANTITGNSGNNTVDAEAGNDLVNAGEGDDTVNGGDGNDTLNGEAGADTLVGGAGNDRLDGGLGGDKMAGGIGDDTYVVDDLGDLVLEDDGAGIDLVESGITYTLTTNTDNLTLTGTADLDGAGNVLNNVINGNAGSNSLAGLEGNDSLFGNAGNDALDGGEGNDLLNGGAGADAMSGGTGDDTYVVDNLGDSVLEAAAEGTDTVQSSIEHTLAANVENLTLTGAASLSGTGNELDNTIIGNTGSNALYGGAGNDTLTDNLGNDRLDGGLGADTMAGGSGNDTYVVDDAGDIVTEGLNLGGDTVESSIDYTLGANLDNLTLLGSADLDGHGNALNNIITGNSGNNTTNAGAGNDTVHAGDGNDVVSGGDGNDLVNGGAGEDRLDGDAGNDTINAGEGDDVVSGGDGIDLLNGDAGNDELDGGAGNDTLNGGLGADNMAGGVGDDIYVVDNAGDIVLEAAAAGTDLVQSSITYTLTDNTENLTLTGLDNTDGTGNELNNIIIGNGGANVLDGLAGNDTISAGAGADTLLGGEGDDVLNGEAGADTLSGEAGNDMLNGGLDADTMRGGSGNDTYIVDNAGDLTVEAADEGVDTVQAGVTYALADNVEHLTLTGTAGIHGSGNELDNTITGNSAGNILNGGAGNDTLIANAGNDILNGGAGADNLQGGIGNDSYIVDDAGDVVVEALNAGIDAVESSIDYVLGANVENLVLSGAALSGTGNALANSITGNDKDNLIDGGAGLDAMSGGAGDDTYIVDMTGDAINEAIGAGTDTARASASYTLGANVENLVLTGSSAINGTGNTLDNSLTGNDAANVLNGGAGADTMSGGAGNDTYVVDNAGDLIVEDADGGIDTVQAGVSYGLAANAENLVLTGSVAIDGSGNELDNVITGNSGNNVLGGGAGNDTLSGGLGADLLSGGTGDDTYRFGRGDGADRITDTRGSDTLRMVGGLAVGDLVGTMSGSDLVISIKGTSDSVVLAGWLDAQEGVNRVVFDNGATLDRAGMIGLVGGAPVAVSDTINAQEDGGAVRVTASSLLANDSNPGATLVSVGASALGAAVSLSGGTVSYDIGAGYQELAQGEVLKDSFSYTVRDSLGRSSTSVVNVQIVGANDGPVASSDSAALAERDGKTVTGNVLANDTDIDKGTVLQVANAGSFAGAYGTLVIAKDGSFTYTLDAAAAAAAGASAAPGGVLTERFNYSATDGIASAGSTLEIAVTLANRAPVAADDAAQLDEDGAAASGNVLANDSDPDTGAALKVAAPGSYAGAYGSLVIAADGSYTYTLNEGDARVQALAQGQSLAERFSYAVTDGTSSTGAALNISIAGTNDAPVVSADTALVIEDGAAARGNVLANDRDVDSGATLAVAAPGSHAGTYGTLEIAADGSYTYTLNNGDARVQALALGQQLVEHFSFAVTDGIADSGSSLTVTIVGANDGPVVTADAAQASEDGDVAVSGNVLANDSDADGAALQVAAPGSYEGAYGTLVLALDGSYTYTLHNGDAKVQSLAQGQSVVDSFTYTATDGSESSEAVLRLTIAGANDAPVVSADALLAVEDEAAAVSGNVLANDQDVDAGTQLQVGAPGTYQGEYGTLVLDLDGSYTYSLYDGDAKVQSLAQGQTVVDSFSYAATDGAASVEAGLQFTITGANDAPVVTADVAQVAAGGALAASGNVLANDSDIDAGGTLAVAAPGTYTGAYGTLSLAQDGSYTYQLDQDSAVVRALGAGQSVVDSFDYLATDGIASILSQLAITVQGANEAPVGALDTAAVVAGAGSVTGNVLANDQDADAGTQLRVATAGTISGAYGSLTLGEDGSYTYLLADSAAIAALGAGVSVVEHFSYTATDGSAQAVAGLDITVTGTNDAPVVAADAASVGSLGTLAATGNVLANDRDPDAGTQLKVSAAGSYAGKYGTLELAQDGSYRYAVNSGNAAVNALEEGQSMVETFSYKATDGSVSVGSTLDITIVGEARKPVLQADTVTIKEDQLLAFGNVLSNDSGKSLKVMTDIDAGSYGVLTVLSSGNYIYALGSLSEKVQSLGRGASVVDHFDYTVVDGRNTLPGTLDVTVLGENDAPKLAKALADKYINFNKAFAFQLSGSSFTDIDKGDTLTYSAKLANGAALPSWLKFDAATGTFSGTAPKTVSTIEVRVTATDKVAATGSTVGSLSVSDVFKLSVSHGNNGWGNGEDAAPPGQETDKDVFGPVLDTWVNLLGGSKGDVAAASAYAGVQEASGAHAMLVGVQGHEGLDFPLA